MEDNGNLILENRSRLSVTAVKDVESFDERRIVFKVGEGRLTILGSGLKITNINVDTGEAAVCGLVDSCAYSGGGRTSLWGKLAK